MEASSTTPTTKERIGLREFWKKVKEVFREKESSSSGPRPATQTAPSESVIAEEPSKGYIIISEQQGPTNAARPSNPTLIEVDAEQGKASTEDQPTEGQQASIEAQTTAPTDPVNNMSGRRRGQSRQGDRVQTLLKKYDVAFDVQNFETPTVLSSSRSGALQERVHKQIRMRVKYTCHSCKTVFGHDRICIRCQHKRCLECSRDPPRRKDKKPKPPVQVIEIPEPPQDQGQWVCHECQEAFAPGAEECPSCHHKICPVCLREASVIAVEAEEPAPIGTDATKAHEAVGLERQEAMKLLDESATTTSTS